MDLFRGSLSNSAIQFSNDIALGFQQELGLFILAQDYCQNKQELAQKAIEIMLDDMCYNLNNHVNNQSFKFISNCLHESIDNINEYLLKLMKREKTPFFKYW